MSLEKQKQLVEESGALGLSIPGLSIEPIIKNIMDKSSEIKACLLYTSDAADE
mgnify:CR=1 FL=1